MIITKTNIQQVEYDYSTNPPKVTKREHEESQCLYLFRELSESAKQAAMDAAIGDEWENPCGHYALASEDIWAELHYLEEMLDLRFHCGRTNEDVWGEAKGTLIDEPPALDEADCYPSMELREVYDKYRPQLECIYRAMEYAQTIEDDDRRWELEGYADEAWDAVRDTIADRIAEVAHDLLEGELDYYTSWDFWGDWLNDGESLFTIDGVAA